MSFKRIPAGYTVARIADTVNVGYAPMTIGRALRIADETRRTLIARGCHAGESDMALVRLARAVRALRR